MKLIDRTFAWRRSSIAVAALFAFGFVTVGGGNASATTLADVDSRLRDIAARYAEDDPEREQLERTYAAAKEHLKASARHQEAAEEYASTIKQGPGLVRELDQKLNEVRQQG